MTSTPKAMVNDNNTLLIIDALLKTSRNEGEIGWLATYCAKPSPLNFVPLRRTNA